MNAAEVQMSLRDRGFDATMRVERITHLAVVGGDDMSHDTVDYLIGDCRAALVEALGLKDADALEAAITEFGSDRDSIREALGQELVWKNVTGWLVEASQPDFTKSGPGLMYSWGVYCSRVFYGATYVEALEKAFAWADARHAAAEA